MTEHQTSTNPERIKTHVYEAPADVSAAVANEIAELIKTKAQKGEMCVLGLATGATPVGVYDELVRMHRQDGLSFQNVITFNLDEYFPMCPRALQSYKLFMSEYLFDHIDIKPENINIPDGTLDEKEVHDYCVNYEKAIEDAGGIDLQLLGIGRTGHIGFNEPGSSRDSVTRLIALDYLTRLDAASDFFGLENVPHRAITMGVGSAMNAKRIIMMAFGENKAPIVARAIEGSITEAVAASFLQEHPDSTVMLDEAAAEDLTRFKCPWVLGPVDWDDHLVRKAVTWLADQVDKPVLKLTDEDYNEHHLQELLATEGSAYKISLKVFRTLQHTITGWPGGKPAEERLPGDIVRSRDEVFPKRILVFSPHPDDDVISMGGTLLRLVDQGHEVHVAFQTSGAIAVFDHDASRYAEFVLDVNREFNIDQNDSAGLAEKVGDFLRNKEPGQVDSKEVLAIKTAIRCSEARAAGQYCGLPEEHTHFLNMPFYETGRVRKSDLGDADIEIVADILRKVKPHQIYAAGDLSDPHGTHRMCLTALKLALAEKVSDEPWMSECEVWLYRGAWQEWPLAEIEMAVPLSPGELARKRNAIFMHESQKDRALFPGRDQREFWQRAQGRNRTLATQYDKLGLAEYEAMEAFVSMDMEQYR
ncbi:MAG: glucosamine-6-phosphate deaminase [Phycisphaerales bacterium]|jgi:glucosamine-6-phosphate deaminase|nr:glucosamine-6-phosphate deaminase [Phycisphaerales bacterium]